MTKTHQGTGSTSRSLLYIENTEFITEPYTAMERQLLPCCNICGWPCGDGVKCKCEFERDIPETFKAGDQKQVQQEHTLTDWLAK